MLKSLIKNIVKIFDPNEKELNKIRPILNKINELENSISKLKDEELKQKTSEFKERVSKGESLDSILPEAYAVVREAGKRILKMRHFDVQIIGGIVLHQGRIAEMKTGEGKTLVATLPAYLNALSSKPVHIVTVNDYLAKRDASWMGPLYNFLNLSVGYIEQLMDKQERQKMYQADITYVTNYEIGFDYLRDNMVYDLKDRVLRGLEYAIIDEVDSILIDEARTPLIISGPADDDPKLFKLFAKIVNDLKRDIHYTVEEKTHSVVLTEEGIKEVEKRLNTDNLYSNFMYAFHINAALKAKELFKKDREYIVENGEIVIVDEFTGRKMYGRRFSGGIHQAIEAKEGVEIKQASKTLATITYQNFFKLYKKLAGMTGTAATEEEEFKQIYGMDVVIIPTYKPTKRKDHPDLIFGTEQGKFKYLVDFVQELNKQGRPVLIGTRNIHKNEIISKMLSERGINHFVLNAKNHEKEAEIIAQAGKLGAVTVATNMAGRGVDIILGGKPLDDSQLCDLPDCQVEFKHTREYHKVAELGGLYVIGTERHESRRIDNQLRGRAGRLGDPGDTVFFVSIEDELFQIFGGSNLNNLMKLSFNQLDEKEHISASFIAKQLDKIQEKIEATHFQIRKTLLAYDDVINRQREAIYKERDKILHKEELLDNLLAVFKEFIERANNYVISYFIENNIIKIEKQMIIDKLTEFYRTFLPLDVLVIVLKIYNDNLTLDIYSSENLSKDLNKIIDTLANVLLIELKQRLMNESQIPEEIFLDVIKFIMLQIVDKYWIEHLQNIEYLREGIKLRGWGNIDPLTAFRDEANQLFNEMIINIHEEIIKNVFKIKIVFKEE
ncbi:MAG: preprotein translocase subunit SecA [bacterium]